MITRKLSSGKDIHIIDNAFTLAEAINFEIYANRCTYKLLGSVESYVSRANGERFFGSTLSESDMYNLGIFETSRFKNISGMFDNMRVLRSWILCTSPSTKYLYHADEIFHPDEINSSSLTFLYYMNTYWHPEWGGDTIFCNDDGEPEAAIACVPNRAVIFPSDILHKPSLTTGDSKFRFTFTTTFIREN